MSKYPNLLPVKSKAQRILAACIGSIIAMVVILTILSDATGIAKTFFSNF